MDSKNIGNYIQTLRKQKGLSQKELAKLLSVTFQAVSKWETGRSLPDSAIMIDLCQFLEITLIDLFSGEVVAMSDYNKELEKSLLEMTKQKEEADKRLLFVEVVIGVVCIAIMLSLTAVASIVQMEEWLRILLIVIGMVPILIAGPFMLRIEQVAGYYECKKCKHRYVPTYKAVNLAPHMGRTRYMRCPQCEKKSWQKKVLSKD